MNAADECKHCAHDRRDHFKWNCSECSKIGKDCPGFELRATAIAKEIEQRGAAGGLREAIRDFAEYLHKLRTDYLDFGSYREADVVDYAQMEFRKRFADELPDIAVATIAHSPNVSRVKEAFEAFNKALREYNGRDHWQNSQLFTDLTEAVDSLSAPADAGDSARLDWLQSQNTTWWWQCRVAGELTQEVTLRSNASEGFRTVRECIDAAMSAQGESNG